MFIFLENNDNLSHYLLTMDLKKIATLVTGCILGSALLFVTGWSVKRSHIRRSKINHPKTLSQWQQIVKDNKQVVTFVGTDEQFRQFYHSNNKYKLWDDCGCTTCNYLTTCILADSPTWIFVHSNDPFITFKQEDNHDVELAVPVVAIHINHTLIIYRSVPFAINQ